MNHILARILKRHIINNEKVYDKKETDRPVPYTEAPLKWS